MDRRISRDKKREIVDQGIQGKAGWDALRERKVETHTHTHISESGRL